MICFRYKPTRLWGFSGHVQTIVHSIIGRVRCPWPIGERVNISLPDETTLTYDLYQPLTHGHEGISYKYIKRSGKLPVLTISLYMHLLILQNFFNALIDGSNNNNIMFLKENFRNKRNY